LLNKNINILRCLSLLTVVLIIMVSVTACKTQPFSTPSLNYTDYGVKKEYTEEYYEERNKLYKERYKQKYGSANENITNNEGVTSDNETDATDSNSTDNQSYQSKLDTEAK
jgi:hypothetical protein